MKPKRHRFKQRRGLQELAKHLDLREATAVEIGSYAGESALILAATGKFQRITCVDPWQDRFTEPERRFEHFAGVEQHFDEATKDHPVIRKLKMTSLDAAPRFDDATLDFVYIDGAHDHASVRADIEAWLPKLKPRRWIAGHDYIPRFQGVIDAVNELLGPPHYVFRDSSWLVRTR